MGRIVYEGDPHLVENLRAEIGAACWGEDERASDGHVVHRFSFDREPEIFDDVGGVRAWRELNETLKAGRLGAS